MFSFLSASAGAGIPLIQKFSSAFHRDENHTFKVLSEIKWWMVPFISSRKEKSLPAELCSLPASGNISRAGHGLQLETSVVIRIWGCSISSLIIWLSLCIRPNRLLKGIFTSMLAKQIQMQVLIYLSWDFDHYSKIMDLSHLSSLWNPYLWADPKQKGSTVTVQAEN